ncbi:hypothetical protein [Melittangium boletus]|uniref:hypothetical protein n=1 Tax=Melittangium boletus TaxID=83453 RepID=UPI003DA50122
MLVSLSKRFGADVSHAFVLRDGQVIDSYYHGAERQGAEVYERDWKDKDPRFAAAKGHFGQVLSDVQVLAPGVFEASAIYNEVLRKESMRYTMFTTAPISSELVLAHAFMRRKRVGAFELDEIQAYTLLLPHLLRALRLRQLVSTLKDELQDLRRALDVVPGSVALLDGAGRLLCCNAAATRLFERGDGVCLDRRTVTCRDSRESRQFATALSGAATLAEGSSERGALPPGRWRSP